MTLSQAIIVNQDISKKTDTSLRTKVATTFETQGSTSKTRTRNRTTDTCTSLRPNTITTSEVQIRASETRTRSQAIHENMETNQTSAFEMQKASRNTHDIMDSTSAIKSKQSNPLHTMVVTKYSKLFRTAELVYTVTTAKLSSKVIYQTRDTKQTSVVQSFDKALLNSRPHKLKCSATSVSSYVATAWLIGLLTSLP